MSGAARHRKIARKRITGFLKDIFAIYFVAAFIVGIVQGMLVFGNLLDPNPR